MCIVYFVHIYPAMFFEWGMWFHYVAQAGSKLPILLSQALLWPQCWDYRYAPLSLSLLFSCFWKQDVIKPRLALNFLWRRPWTSGPSISTIQLLELQAWTTMFNLYKSNPGPHHTGQTLHQLSYIPSPESPPLLANKCAVEFSRGYRPSPQTESNTQLSFIKANTKDICKYSHESRKDVDAFWETHHWGLSLGGYQNTSRAKRHGSLHT